MTIAKVISVSYKFENNLAYVYVTMQRREPMDDIFIMKFYSPKEVDNFCMLDARLRGLNIRTRNRTEFETMYKRAKADFLQALNTMRSVKNSAILYSPATENVLPSF
uniref:Uncharacterized protein n=1 Tax=viral metagenome TaxID=1070528 RepID=A0A6C0F2U2_9ZZZZ